MVDRLGTYAQPGRVEAIADDRPMMDLLDSGELDAVFTPFMPSEFFGRDSAYRHLLTDFRERERAYFAEVGYVPGIHILGLRDAIVRENPWLPGELSELVDESQRVWLQKRKKYAETTPWMIEEIARSARDLPEEWNASGLPANRRMIADFVEQVRLQGLADIIMSSDQLFPSVDQFSGETA